MTCKNCQSTDLTEYAPPGGGVQYRCAICDWFVDWHTRPESKKSSKRGKK